VHLAIDRQKKVALLGAREFEYSSSEARIECFPWNQLNKVRNLADYDEVVLNTSSLRDSARSSGATIRNVLDTSTAHEILRPPGEGAIFVLGDPRIGLAGKTDDKSLGNETFLSWTGFEFVWDDRSGTTLEPEAGPNFKLHTLLIDKLDGWKYSLKACKPLFDSPDSIWLPDELLGQGFSVRPFVKPLVKNRYGNPVVFSVRHVAEPVEGGPVSRRRTEPIVLGGPIVFLPELRFSEEEFLEFVLQVFCEVDVSAPEPEWVSTFVAPGQSAVDRNIADLDARMRELIDERDRAVEERNQAREPLKLLYETGRTLEEVVWRVFEQLGAEVEQPKDRTKEDGWIKVVVGDETLEGVLEIKGVRGRHFDWRGLRQLSDWIERGMSLRKKRYFGIFVGNSAIEDPPRHRVWPFNKNWVDQANMREYAGIRTEDLYVLYLLDQTDRIDRDAFWRELFSTKGPFDMRPYWKQLSEAEKAQFSNLPQT
jgi:hypothetical protein